MHKMKPLTVEWTTWNNVERADINTWEEANALIERAASQSGPPSIMEFFSPDSGQSLGLGIGRKSTVVTYQDSLDPPYFVSLGDKDALGTEWFRYGGEETEYLARNLVSMNKGMDALKQFVINRMQPGSFDWERL
jgi:Immunity protein Imm1